jgi:hypothetical protein
VSNLLLLKNWTRDPSATLSTLFFLTLLGLLCELWSRSFVLHLKVLLHCFVNCGQDLSFCD